MTSSQDHFGAPSQRPQDAKVSKNYRSDNDTLPRPLFVHANFPKFDPATIFALATQPQGAIGPCFDSNGTAIRVWAPKRRMEAIFGYDIERAFWEEIEHVACEYEHVFETWKDKKEVCQQTRRWIFAVFGEESLYDNE